MICFADNELFSDYGTEFSPYSSRMQQLNPSYSGAGVCNHRITPQTGESDGGGGPDDASLERVNPYHTHDLLNHFNQVEAPKSSAQLDSLLYEEEASQRRREKYVYGCVRVCVFNHRVVERCTIQHVPFCPSHGNRNRVSAKRSRQKRSEHVGGLEKRREELIEENNKYEEDLRRHDKKAEFNNNNNNNEADRRLSMMMTSGKINLTHHLTL